MEDMELIEKYFRKELNGDESARFRERLAADSAFKSKFETESLVHKALQFSRERERIKVYATNLAPMATSAAQWLDNKALVMAGLTSLAVWIFSTFSSGLTGLSPESIKWVGLTVAVGASMFVFLMKNRTMNLRLTTASLFNGILVFVMASGIDAINHGTAGIVDKSVAVAHLVPLTGDKPWWPTQSLQDSLDANRKHIQEMRDKIRTLVRSRMPNLNFGSAPAKFETVVIPRSATVVSGSTYEADIYLATSPLAKKFDMQVDGKSIAMEAGLSGVMRGKISFKATANAFDNTGAARRKFVASVMLGDSTYRKVVEYSIARPK